ncbi:NUDIX domain-containing protein [Kitasatospora sp. NPDC059973]|uniref:NUDIX domain-containing protein n=1 Tax=Kitasatospora sp. NPDC059973 TaxID=3347020 RepID=UPI00367E1397
MDFTGENRFPAVASAPMLDDPAARVHRFLGADPRATVCGRTNGPDSPMELTVADLYAVLNGNATKAQESRVRAFVDEFDALRDTDHPEDTDHIWTAHGGAVLHSDDVRALLDGLNPHREDPTDALPVLLAWPGSSGEYRIRRDLIGPLLAHVEALAAEDEPIESIRYTADVVCVRGGEVLLIERGWPPHKGELAVPGGHVDRKERAQKAGARELREETGIRVAEADLTLIGLFDAPDRDTRGRYVSAAYLVEVPAGTEAQAGDDAAAVHWVPLTDLPEHLAFDHAEILAAARQMLTAAETN